MASLPPHQVIEEQNQIKKSITISSKQNESASSRKIERKKIESRTKKELSEQKREKSQASKNKMNCIIKEREIESVIKKRD